jgi:ATP-dependent protease ClpP protease subunit
VVVGTDAVDYGLIDQVGGINEALSKLEELKTAGGMLQ